MSPLHVCGRRVFFCCLKALTMITQPAFVLYTELAWSARVHGPLPVPCFANCSHVVGRHLCLAVGMQPSEILFLRTSGNFVFKRVSIVCVRRVASTCSLLAHDSLVAIIFVKIILAVVHDTNGVGILHVAAANQHCKVLVVERVGTDVLQSLLCWSSTVP